MTDELFICPACNKRKLYVSLVKPGNPWICHNAYCPGIDGKGRRSGLGRELPFSISAPPKEAPKPTKGSDPPESWPLKTGDFELEYLLQERAIEPWVINAMPIRRTATGILFLFPECDYWQERRWKPFPPRWKNMSGEGVGASNGAMYLVRVTHNDTLFLVEGIIDALSIGAFAPAASTLSYTVHPAQLDKVRDLGYSSVVYCPDNDVPTREILRNQHVLSEHGIPWKLARVPATYKDPNDVPHDELRDWVNGQI